MVHTAQLAVPHRRTLLLSVLEGLFHALMLGIAESYLGALAVELGHRDVALAVLSAAPLCMGFGAQLFSAALAAWLGSRKRLIVIGASIQALTHVGFAAVAWTDNSSFALFLLVKTLYFVSGLIIGPPWGAWMSALISGPAREQYFARRSAAIQLMLLVAFGGAGLLLFGAQANGASSLGMFALLNLSAMVARFGSVFCLALQDDIVEAKVSRYDWTRLSHAFDSASWRIPVYVALLILGAHTAVPFFTPYMLRELGLDYANYALLTAMPIAVKAVTSPFFFVLAQRLGMRSLFMMSTGLIAIVALLWARFSSLEVLILAQVLSGLAWGAFEYASYQLLLQSSPEHTRIEFLSLANALAGIAQLIGAILGGLFLLVDKVDYQTVFLVSAAARALPIAFATLIVPKRVPVLSRLLMRVVSVRPSGGAVHRPVSTLDKTPSDTPTS